MNCVPMNFERGRSISIIACKGGYLLYCYQIYLLTFRKWGRRGKEGATLWLRNGYTVPHLFPTVFFDDPFVRCIHQYIWSMWFIYMYTCMSHVHVGCMYMYMCSCFACYKSLPSFGLAHVVFPSHTLLLCGRKKTCPESLSKYSYML